MKNRQKYRYLRFHFPIFSLFPLLFILLFSVSALAGEAQNEAGKEDVNQSISQNVKQTVSELWNVSWERFFVPETHIFYDYLTSYEQGKYQQHLPTQEEVAHVFPNECGYDTGMEDGMIFSGPWLTAIISREECESDVEIKHSLKTAAHEVFLGIESCATVHSSPGFLARAVLPADGKSVYPNSSRDQYTHAVHGMWHYYHSPFCQGNELWPADEAEKERIRKVLSLIADRMMKNVIPENDYDSLRLDGSRDTRGISRMWNVAAHEAARLPMIYAAAWDTCRESTSEELQKKSETYYKAYRKYITEAVDQSLALDEGTLRRLVMTYALLQMQSSLELLYQLETDADTQKKIIQGMEMCFDIATQRIQKAEHDSKGLDMTFLFQDWRINGGGIPWATPVRKIWYSPRESGEAALTQLLCPTRKFPEESRELLYRAILRINPDRVATSGIFYLVSAWWNDEVRREHD